MSEVETPVAGVSTTERWSSLARRARGAMEVFRTMVVQAQETKDEIGANICGEGVMLAIVVLDTIRARCPEALAPDAAGDIDPDPLTFEETEHVMTEVDRRVFTMRRFVHPDAATGGQKSDNLVRNVQFRRRKMPDAPSFGDALRRLQEEHPLERPDQPVFPAD